MMKFSREEYKRVFEIISLSSKEYVGWADGEDSEAYENDLYNVLRLLAQNCPKDLLELPLTYPLGQKLDKIENNVYWYDTIEYTLKEYVSFSRDEIRAKIASFEYDSILSWNTYDEVLNDLDWFEHDSLDKSDYDLIRLKLPQLLNDLAIANEENK